MKGETMNRNRWIALLRGLVVAALASLFAVQRSAAHCMAECPSPPAGCVRTTIDPGSCATSCASPLPQCHYAQSEDAAGAVCPPLLVGRCIP